MTEPRSYYGRPILKAPVWTPEVPVYFWVGGIAGASTGLALGAELAGNPVLARNAWRAAMAGIAASPPLLISDLGRPERFLNMLRLFKVTSPMSLGSWSLQATGLTTTVAFANSELGLFPRLADVAKPAAAFLGLTLATYTGALLASTAIPVWHEARRELPFLFASGAAASAGAVATIATPAKHARPARRLALMGAAAEVVAGQVMEHRLGALAEPYHEEPWMLASRVLSIAGGLTVAVTGSRSRVAAVAGGAAIAAGALATRWAVYKAGRAGTRDPKHVVGPQRERLAARA